MYLCSLVTHYPRNLQILVTKFLHSCIYLLLASTAYHHLGSFSSNPLSCSVADS
ncbi:hypothetical protein HOLleu_18125 [Holothuria leucospilota]|uniref:Uncharacterized protein n=1 Tax=Holothuria leucospilota TaxID=206669 RepID=A0A9Q1C2N4_HOLLE|nr:hypothetical protein HOLleu_18125 [Holothuria leucospilota]